MFEISKIELDTPLQSIPYGEQWMGEWAIEHVRGDALVGMLSNLSLSVHLQQQAKAMEGESRRLVLTVSPEGIAQINLTNSLMKQRASFSNNTSTVEARQLLRAAAKDPEVKGIVLYIDSPGGTVAGTSDLAAEVNRAKAKKPVYAYIEDLGASAAYWIASQATKVFANETAIVGSIGTYMQVIDYRRKADQLGMTVHVVKAGSLKGAGAPGTEITAEQLADFQRVVNSLNDQFLAGVASGRKLSLEAVKQLATGQTWVGQQAVDLKLVDRVASAEDVFSELVSLTSAATKPPKGKPMSQNSTDAVAAIQPQPATVMDLEQHLPKASGEFKIAQLKAGATLAQAMSAYVACADAQIAAQAQEIADLKAKQAMPGNQPHGESKTPSGNAAQSGVDAVAEWNAAVSAKVAQGMTRAQATSACVKENRQLHAAFVAASNGSRR